MTPYWIFLDFDNTLMGTEAVSLPSLIARFNALYAEKIGRDLTLEEFFEHFQGQVRESLCASLSAYFDIHVDYAILFADREWNMMQYLQKHRVPMADHLLEAFAELQKHGAHFAVVSNNPVQRYVTAMRYASNGRGAELLCLIGPYLFEAGDKHKPDPTVFLRAMAQCEADPAFSCAVEDSPAGVRSALSAGLKTFGYLGYAEHPELREKELLELGAAACFTDWADFPALWRSHAGR